MYLWLLSLMKLIVSVHKKFTEFEGSCGKDTHGISLADRCSIVTSVHRTKAIRKTDARSKQRAILQFVSRYHEQENITEKGRLTKLLQDINVYKI